MGFQTLLHTCTILSINLCYIQSRHTDFLERDLEQHREHCRMVDDRGSSTQVRENLSTTYGVKKLSVLDKINFFDVCQCLPEDIMHVLYEGVIPYETKNLIRLLEAEGHVSLQQLNSAIENFDYGYMNAKDKPCPITRETLNSRDGKLKQYG